MTDQEVRAKIVELSENGEKNIRKLDIIANQLLQMADINNPMAIEACKEFCLNNKLDLLTRLFVYRNIVRIGGQVERNFNEDNFKIEKPVYDVLMSELKKKIDTTNMKPLENRNSNRIVILTEQFLELRHGPTNCIGKIIKMINDNYPQINEVYILTTNAQLPEVTLSDKYAFSYRKPPIEEKELNTVLDHFKIDRCGVGYIANDDLKFIPRLAHFTELVYDLNPCKVISIGMRNYLAELVSDFIEVYGITFDDDDKDANVQHIIVLDEKKAKEKNRMEFTMEEYYKKMMEYIIG
ncbi:MAG: hypothetical protein BEN19_07905 [Epulopiscium sp. Nuni2H_MBin003]|nr:MAG: hypothetical protein BEN19_07905 [Epulopiscium sp. Nuni2H_MBin003]